MNNIFVGNLSFTTTKEQLLKLFEPFGAVANVVIMERKKGKSRGYGFVDMPNEEEKNKAIAGLDGKEFMWRVLSVSLVAPKVKGEVRPKKFKSEQSATKPWFKSEEEDSKPPYKKFEGGSKPPYKKFEGGDNKPYRRDERDSRPTGNTRSSTLPAGREDKPWNKNEGGSKPPYKKFEGGSKPPYKKFEGRDNKPYRRDERDSGKPKSNYSSSRPTGNSRHEGRPAGGKFSHREDDRGSKSPYKKYDGASKKPWDKKEGGSKPPYRRDERDSRPTGSSTGTSCPEGKPWEKDKREGFSKSTGKPGGAFKMFNKAGKSSKTWPKKGQGRT